MSLATPKAVTSLFPRLEPLLARVNKPIQYVGGELNSVAKNWDAVDVRWCLSYPDAYEVGLPNQGIAMLNTLDLAGIPLHAADQHDHDPLVLAGGHAAFNPEPIADFLDAAVLGDGEEVVLAITEVVREWKAEGRPGGRDEILMRLAASGGVYVPKFYAVSYLANGRIQRVAPNRPGVPWRVHKHTVMDLDSWPYPRKPLVPLAETVHERFSVEIFRGCTRGCRFCQAGMITRPV